MAHHIYHTRGVILLSRPSGESNRFYKIFTDELGLVGATAQAVREGKSKLRYTLQDFSFVTVDLVRGKEVWRIVSAGPWRSFEKIKSNEEQNKLFIQFLALPSRLLQGEGRDDELFAEIINVVEFLEKDSVPAELELAFGTLSELRLLIHMGYLDKAGYERFSPPQTYSISLLKEFEGVRRGALSKIKEAWNVSHL